MADRGSNLMSAGFWLEDFLTLGYRNPRCFFPLIWHEASKYSTISRISFSKFNLGISQGSWKNNEFQTHNFKTFEITDNLEISKNLASMSHLCSPHKWPMEIGHHKWSLKAIVIPNAKHEGYNGSFLGSRVVTKCHWSRVRTTQIPLFSLLTTSKSPHLP